jgi:hypothetical protein
MAGKYALLILLLACEAGPFRPGRVLIEMLESTMPRHGQRTLYIAEQRVQLTRRSSRVRPPVKVHASPANVGPVYVGGANVTSGNGYALGPGESGDFIITDPSLIWLVATHDGDGVSWYAAARP